MTDKHPTPWTIAYDDNDQGWIKSASGAHLVGFGTDDKDFWESIVATVNKHEALLVEIEQHRAERDVLKARLHGAHHVIERLRKRVFELGRCW